MNHRFPRLLGLALGASLAFGAIAAATIATADEVNIIPDAGLRQCIANTMHDAGIGAAPGDPEYGREADSISQADLDALADATTSEYRLACGYAGTGLASLEGLQYFHDPQLTTIEVQNSPDLADLSPLSGMTQLTSLMLGNVSESISLAPLTGMTRLTDLDLGFRMTNLTSLPELPSLTTFSAPSGLSSLSGVEKLTNLRELNAVGCDIPDLTPLGALTDLTSVYIPGSQITRLDGLQASTHLSVLDLSNNHITDISALSDLSELGWVDLSNNQITNISALTGFNPVGQFNGPHDGGALYLHNNDISDITPLADYLNSGVFTMTPDATWGTGVWSNLWTLSGNQITDLSSLSWGTIGKLWANVPSEYTSGSSNFAVTNQTSASTAVMGATVPLPTNIKAASGSPHPITWTVASGDATINQAARTITYNSIGPVQLAWTDTFDADCLDSYWGASVPCDPAQDTLASVSFFSGTVAVNVTDASQPTPEASAPNSYAVRDGVSASTTGGAARLADGSDSYTLTTTVRADDHTPLTGYASRLMATPSSSEVTVSDITDNGDGTYSLAVTSTTPGNYTVAISLDGTVLGEPISVNFIAATIAQASRTAGQAQSATGLGFLPSEQVTAVLHSTTIELGTYAATDSGSVPVSFNLPATFETGRHTVDLIGETSGAVQVGFDVITASGDNSTTSPSGNADGTTKGARGDTGGAALSTGASIPMVLALGLAIVTAALIGLRLGRPRRTH